uniref:Nonstructural protein n=1 Tax=Gokushovirinae environmental samples TaxID=1478972 RepID=A0A2R3UAG8_9VIRU|nr:nonstructural protein [Gokushovirinae environmental samples]
MSLKDILSRKQEPNKNRLLKVIAVYDSKAQVFNQPQFLRSAGEASRAWEAALTDPKQIFCAHPADFTLFEIGEYDDQTGTLYPHQIHVNLGNGAVCKPPSTPNPQMLPMQNLEPQQPYHPKAEI